LPYEQPGPYIVNSTDYNDSFETPVITPGKSFILGYTSENEGIYRVGNSKVIIFDDFTTASRLIDFDFKVKSSAMKILKSSNDEMFSIDYLYYFLQTLYINNDTHKRYWISEYAPIRVKIHTYDEQLKIIEYFKIAYDILDSINTF
jgi:type I restriction enzyme S subunit